MNTKIAHALDSVEGKPLKCALRRTPESFVRAGRLVDLAISRAHLTRDEAAGLFGVSPSLLSRQLQNEDNQHVSFQRLWSMPQAFKLELLRVLAEDLDGVRVRTVIELGA
jgi:transcriptional regulator with XRE-family HTH domain